MTSTHTLSVANDKLWNIDVLIDFLVQNQNKDINLIVNPEAHCLRSAGVYDLLEKFKFNSVTINTHNQVEQHPSYKINYGSIDNFFNDWNRYDLTSSGIWNRQKIFGAFYGRPTANRIGIASYLYCNHPDISDVKLVTGITDEDDRCHYEVDKVFTYESDSLSRIGQMTNTFKFGGLNYTQFGHELDYKSPWMKAYENIMIDIVSEPNIKGDTFYPTEKLVRAILLKKPFIAMTSRGYLSYLHQMGFKTFCNFWSEDYDGFESKDRYLTILKLIDHLSALGKNKLEHYFSDMQDILNYNYNLIVTQTYTKKITLIQ
jgi:hypothetical protein